MIDIGTLVDHERGLVDPRIFSDKEIFRREMDNVFGRCWLFVGHESMVPNNGDYVTTYMGEDSVVLIRDTRGTLRVFLNRCRHRGNKVCLFDRGTISSFTCSYHGWSYNTQGHMLAAPFEDEAYYGELEKDKPRLGLIEVPKVTSYGGLIYACWDAGAMSLDDYLGEARWYLDNFLIVDYLGGLEFIPGKQRYLMPVNWKLLAENFAGDDYHFYVTHASVIRLLNRSRNTARIAHAPGREETKGKDFCVTLNYPRGVPHAFLELKIGSSFYEHDLAQARALGPEAAEWVEYRYQRLQERLGHTGNGPYSFHGGTLFPNFSLIGVSTPLYGRGLVTWHPKGPHQTEVWQWCAVERNAPRILKERAIFVLMQRQAAAGLVAPDDHENFERLTENVRTPVARRYPFHYNMGLGHDGDEPSADTGWSPNGVPGRFARQFSELNQREFYRYWSQLMSEAI